MITQKERGIILPLEKLSLMLIPHRPVPFPLSVRAPNLKMLRIRDCRFRNLSLQYCPKALAQYHVPRQLPMPLANHRRSTLLCMDTFSLKRIKCVFCILRSWPNL
uniref:Uncharacterized protein n=1 Tax=Kalanchoe fedtschenkoi TaxID=63787 RepID=A0A7N0U1D1_KALFE